MPALALPALAPGELPEGLVVAGAYATVAEGEEYGLVALALGHEYWLAPTPAAAGWLLLVTPEAAAHLRPHFSAYARERLRWPPAPLVDPAASRPLPLFGPFLWAALILALFRYRGAWDAAFVLDAREVFAHGQVWRAFTALFLHGSAEHVLANAISGAFVFAAVLSVLGRLRGWLLLALTAFVGNLATAAVNYPGAYRSLGASTAIFAAVGLLTGRALRFVAASRHPQRWRALFIPLAAGLTVLALHGMAATPQVDVGAHLCGWLAGLGGGLLARPDPAQR